MALKGAIFLGVSDGCQTINATVLPVVWTDRLVAKHEIRIV